ncbi:uncharacterized protein [Prorops nasuta]|uniref:uncharacterized protein n=1 Tax=Prorops nasuta TaxID=863751 RepID=UPI0034CDDF41
MNSIIKTSKIVYTDGFCYYRNVRKKDKAGNEVIYLKCKRRTCVGSAKIINSQLHPIKAHNHEKEDRYLKTALFREKLLQCVKTVPINLRKAYDYISKQHIEASALIRFKSIKKTLTRQRSQTCPYNPKTLKDIILISKIEIWQEALTFSMNSEKHQNSFHLLQSVTNKYHAILYNVKLVQMFHDVTYYSIDATYYSMPKLKYIYQLLTIMGKINNKFVACAWALMSGKHEEDCIEVLRYIKASVIKNLNMQKVITDYELALQNAIKIIFPFCKLQGCYFHYNDKKKAKKLKLYSIIKKSTLTHIKALFILRKLFNLPLLPASTMKVGFDMIDEDVLLNDDI